MTNHMRSVIDDYKDTEATLSSDQAQKWHIELDRLLDNSDFRQRSLDVARYLHQKLIGQGENTRKLADVLHGKFLGHPLHPLLTDMTIGSWTLGFLYDMVGLIPGTRKFRRTADSLTFLGVLSALPTALAGMVDYAAIKQDAVNYGASHGLLNGIALFCYARSTLARLSGQRGRAFFFALVGFGLIIVSSWLGGDLVYRHRVGVNHVPKDDLDEWTAVMLLDELGEGEPTRVEVNDTTLLLFRRDDEVYAINAVCSHAGGPLAEGQVVDDVCIECPWHQSVFDMTDGHVVHSPATFQQPHYAVRIQNSNIEVRSVN